MAAIVLPRSFKVSPETPLLVGEAPSPGHIHYDESVNSGSPTPPSPTTVYPLYSSVDNRLLSWIDEAEVQKLLRAKRARLVRDRKGTLRRLYLTVRSEDERDPSVWDLAGRMLAARKSVFREVTNAEQRHWTWSFKLRGPMIDVARATSLREIAKDGILGLEAQRASEEIENGIDRNGLGRDGSRIRHRSRGRRTKVQPTV
jgi:hypothetical protein